MDAIDTLPGLASEILAEVRKQEPRVHCLTNVVAANISANILLSVGARPSMTENPSEISAFASTANALLVNLGMLTEDRKRAINLAVETVTSSDIPWVLDPVKIATSPERRKFADRQLKLIPTALRANYTEFEALSTASPETVTARTGPVDQIEGNRQVVTISNGHHLADRVTAMGCAEGALIAAFLAVSQNAFIATASAVLVFNIAAEIAAETANGPGTFQAGLLDSLYCLDETAIAERARLERNSTA